MVDKRLNPAGYENFFRTIDSPGAVALNCLNGIIAVMKNSAKSFFTRDEIQMLREASNAVGSVAVARTWALIFAAFLLAGYGGHWLFALLTVVILGTRQLALAIIMHEGAHQSLAKSRRLNDVLGQWFGAAPIIQNMPLYRQHHLKHHRFTGRDTDPDLRLATGFPVTQASLIRKLLRDLVGLTGIKILLASLLMVADVVTYNVNGSKPERYRPQRTRSTQVKAALSGLFPTIATNLLLLLILSAIGIGWTYWLWWAAYLTSYQLVLRVRVIAEHGMTDSPEDALKNARTTYGRRWERFLFAPLNVNYHLEHHMMPTVPFFKLPTMHQMLKQKGAFDGGEAEIVDNYGTVLKMASSA